MGVWLSISDRDGLDRPGWTGGMAGERELAALLIRLPHRTPEGSDEHEGILRPLDIAEARAAEAQLDPDRPNPHRWGALLDRLEANPDEWAAISW